jgi:hypothetical protein
VRWLCAVPVAKSGAAVQYCCICQRTPVFLLQVAINLPPNFFK